MQNITFVCKISLKKLSNKKRDKSNRSFNHKVVHQIDHMSQDYISFIKDM